MNNGGVFNIPLYTYAYTLQLLSRLPPTLHLHLRLLLQLLSPTFDLRLRLPVGNGIARIARRNTD
jgi:hypothetical protein